MGKLESTLICLTLFPNLLLGKDQLRCTAKVGLSSISSQLCQPKSVCIFQFHTPSLSAAQQTSPHCPGLVPFSSYQEYDPIYLFPFGLSKKQAIIKGGKWGVRTTRTCSPTCPYLGTTWSECPYFYNNQLWNPELLLPEYKDTRLTWTQQGFKITLNLPFEACQGELILGGYSRGYDPLVKLTLSVSAIPDDLTIPTIPSFLALRHQAVQWKENMLAMINLTIITTQCPVCVSPSTITTWQVLWNGTAPTGQFGSILPIAQAFKAENTSMLNSPGLPLHCYDPVREALVNDSCKNALVFPPFKILFPSPTSAPRHRRALPAGVWLALTLSTLGGAGGAVAGGLSLAQHKTLIAEVEKDIQMLTGAIQQLTANQISIANMVLQNRRALDLLTLAQGGTCKYLGEDCCFLNLTYNQIEVLNDREPLDSRVLPAWSWALSLPQWARNLIQTGITILVLCGLALCLAPALIRCVQGVAQKTVSQLFIVQYTSLPSDEDSTYQPLRRDRVTYDNLAPRAPRSQN
uniref:Env polyprotein n=1 Tax=Eptesicus fuscus deltaretrovirus TaxID=2772270 RepID=A0A7H1JFJ2_9DELA|nr:Env [Eptesicus fuscus deltaretrovirus]